MSQKQRVFYRTTLEDTRNGGKCYQHLTLQVFHESLFTPDGYVTFTWQTDDDNDRWYAGEVIINCRCHTKLQEAYKLAARLTRNMNGYEFSLADILGRLDRIRAVEVAYDPRLSENLPLDQIAPAHLRRYMDNYKVYENGSRFGCGIRYAVLAANEEEAKKEILKKAAEDGDTDFITRFIEANQPVFYSSTDRVPNTTPIRERIDVRAEEV